MQTVKINGKQYPVKIGLNAMRTYCLSKKIELNDLIVKLRGLKLNNMKLADLDLISEIILAGIADGLRKENKDPEHGLKIDDIIDMMEENPEELLGVFENIANSISDPQKPKPGNPRSLKNKANR